MRTSPWHLALRFSVPLVPLLLVACSAPSPKLGSMAETGAPKGTVIKGTLVAIRPVTAQSPISPGAGAVLGALQLPAPASAPNATEFVIQREDGSVATVALPAPQSSPTASLAAADFAVGDHVELLTGERQELLHHVPASGQAP